MPAVLLGSITGVAGGLVRDVLARENADALPPDSRLYAVPAVFGCALLVALGAGRREERDVRRRRAGAPPSSAGAAARLWRGWTAPVPRESRLGRP